MLCLILLNPPSPTILICHHNLITTPDLDMFDQLGIEPRLEPSLTYFVILSNPSFDFINLVNPSFESGISSEYYLHYIINL